MLSVFGTYGLLLFTMILMFFILIAVKNLLTSILSKYGKGMTQKRRNQIIGVIGLIIMIVYMVWLLHYFQ